ncbi:YhdP family protein [Niveibacterium microcysteis]|uniref:TIGR02099 family protein n=1 Tax=Niveibacterium microcysteis TaxID=2811415 RepID=A0ABX7M3S7_9RHOO|nr:YhdP family protein [Niveibacterium microcysteis]QSI75828.1 TIGR02099 family protein [Niveibacterium microcysteis]
MLPSYFRFQLSRYAPAGAQTPWVRVAVRLAVAAFFIAGLALLALRYAVLPRVGEWRPQVEQRLSLAIGLPVKLARLDADWDGLRPRLRLHDLRLHDANGAEALRLASVDASLSWRSLFVGAVRLHQLTVDRPVLSLQRDTDGAVHLQGLPATRGADHNALTEWVFAQPSIVIRGARLTWVDLKRGAPPLAMTQLNLRLENDGREHRFGLTAQPPIALASPIDLRGRLEGERGSTADHWSGQLYASVDRADFAAWHPWFDWPMHVASGVGGTRLWLTLEAGAPVAAVSELALRDVKLLFGDRLGALSLRRLTGHLEAARRGGTWLIGGRELALHTGAGQALAPASFHLERSAAEGGKPAHGEFSATQLDVGALAAMAAHLPLPSAWRDRLQVLAPHGVFEQIKLAWTGEDGVPAQYRVATRFKGLGLAPHGLWPGGDGWSGSLEANERGGRYDLSVAKGEIALPAVFEQGEIPIDEAAFVGDWTLRKGEASVRLTDGRFSNADAAGSASGVWRTRGTGPGEIDITAQLSRADGRAVWRYMPLVVAADVRHWLRDAITGGVAEDARLVLRGDLAHFPFTDDPKGAFTVDARVRGSRLAYAPAWPAIDDIDGSLHFNRARMEIDADRGKVFGANVSKVKAVVADLNQGHLVVDGHAAGPTREFLQFLNASPIAASVGYFTRGVEAVGDGALSLHLAVPLADPVKTTTEGEFRFADNRLRLLPGLPELSSASGRFSFTESRFAIPEASGLFLGTPVKVRGDTRRDGAIEIEARGSVAVRHLASQFPSPVWDHLAGETPVTARVVTREHDVSLALDTSLLGVASSLPEPFNKPASQVQPMHLDWRWSGSGQQGRQQVEGGLAGRARVRFELFDRPEGLQIEQGVLALGGAEASLPAHGLALRARLDRLDLDAWRSAIGRSGYDEGAPPFDSIDVRAGDLVLKGLRFHDQGFTAQRTGTLWQGQLKGPAAEGDVSIDMAGAGRVQGRLSRLALLPAQRRTLPLVEQVNGGERQMPRLDIKVASFAHAARELGALTLRGTPDGNDWLLDELLLSNDDGKVAMTGAYIDGHTRVRFELDAHDAGALLGRLGHAGLLRRGEVSAKGFLDWQGAPEAPQLASLSGGFDIKASSGQFSKIDPGMGRLLGVFSLQALPRRATLDFRDVFSEGFAFDSVSGSMKISHGVMRTEDLSIRGPAAQVSMRGSVDLSAETQRLQVQVQPTLSETVALGAALGPAIGTLNPAVGLVAYLAQKVLRDPIEKIFTYEYAVDGSWDEPRVRKLSGGAAHSDNNGGEQ